MGWYGYYLIIQGNTRPVIVDNIKRSLREGYELADYSFDRNKQAIYLAIKTPNNQIKGCVVLYSLKKLSRGHYELLTKFVDEEAGPCECKCPKRILQKLSPTSNEFAIEWRNECARNLNSN